MAAAAGNRLSTPDQIEAAARALVYDAGGQVKPAFREVMFKFADSWMGLSSLSNLEKDRNAFPDFTPEIQDALAEETRQFLATVLFEEKGNATSLLTAPYTVVSAPLARYYGLPGGAAGFAKVPRAPGTGLGLLAQGSLLSVESHNVSTSPTKRGNFIRSRILCGIVPPPPPVVADLPPPTGAETTRQRYEVVHLQDNTCKACHKMFDPLGFAFEHLDATGRYRAKEGRFDIDDSGEMIDTSAGTIPFRGPAELSTALAKLPEVSSCMASYMAAFAFGLSQQNASCLVQSATNDLRGGMSLVDFYIRMARSEHFRTRLP
jgi:predicted ester cyclase